MSNNFSSVVSLNNNQLNRFTTRKRSIRNGDEKVSYISISLNEVGNEREYRYLEDVQKCCENTTVTIKSMNAGDVKSYYEKWKKQPVNTSSFNHEIIISPKVLKHMEKNPTYADQMLNKIRNAAIPKGFGNATIYEYKVIVRDDGEIETLASADFGYGDKESSNDDEKEERQEHNKINDLQKPLYYNRIIYNNGVCKLASLDIIENSDCLLPVYLYQKVRASKSKKL